jgi:hypothetical protein
VFARRAQQLGLHPLEIEEEPAQVARPGDGDAQRIPSSAIRIPIPPASVKATQSCSALPTSECMRMRRRRVAAPNQADRPCGPAGRQLCEWAARVDPGSASAGEGTNLRRRDLVQSGRVASATSAVGLISLLCHHDRRFLVNPRCPASTPMRQNGVVKERRISSSS